jgi:DASS family divalent anion:Na+ symporter
MVMNFFVLDLLPPPERAHFDWLAWLLAAAPAGIVIFICAAVMLLVLFRAPGRPRAIAAMLRRQQQVLGPVSPREGVLLAAVAVLVGGVLLRPLLAIDPAWLAVGALALTLAGGGLDRDSYRSAIDWGFLTFFGVLLGTGGVLHSVGVDAWISMRLVPLAQRVGDPGMLVLLLGIFVILCRVVLPWIPATLVLSLALVPAAGQVGIAPWVVGFVVLLVANTWLHPNQSDFHRVLRDATGADLVTQRDNLIAGVALTVITLVAVLVSIPYWRALGLLGP